MTIAFAGLFVDEALERSLVATRGATLLRHLGVGGGPDLELLEDALALEQVVLQRQVNPLECIERPCRCVLL